MGTDKQMLIFLHSELSLSGTVHLHNTVPCHENQQAQVLWVTNISKTGFKKKNPWQFLLQKPDTTSGGVVSFSLKMQRTAYMVKRKRTWCFHVGRNLFLNGSLCHSSIPV